MVGNAADQEGAIEAARQGLQLAEQLSSALFQREDYLNLFNAYYRLFDAEKALENAYIALELSQEMNDRRGEAVVYYMIGNVNWQILNYDEARDILEEVGDRSYLGNVYNNLVNVTDSVDLQMEYAGKALTIFEETGHRQGIAFVNNTLGSVHHDHPTNRDLNKALEHYLVAAEIWEEMGYDYGLLHIYGNIGSVYAEQGKTKQALPYLDEAMAMARASGADEEVSDINYYYFLAYGNAQDFDRAKVAVDSFMAARERVYTREKQEVVAEVETKYQTEQTERALAENQLQLEREKNTRKNILIGVIIAFLLLFGLFQYYRNRQRIVRKETELALQLERAEVEKLRELDQLKSNFFANISHEFRTPLTLILSPLSQMIDETFLRQILENIEAHMEEETFSVVELNQSVGMSRSQLHRKLKALTDKSPNQVIREMRLQRAKALLEKRAGNASEVAFMVGFNSLAYFSKCFKDQFDVSPSEVL